MTAIDPGEGWRLLVEGELIPENAEWEKHKGDWIKADIRYHVGGKWTAKQWVPFRVPIKPIDNIGVEVTTSGPCVAIEVHRAALAEIERLKAELGKRCEIWRIARDIAANERDATESEVKRLKTELEAVKQAQTELKWFDLTPFGEHRLRKDIDQYEKNRDDVWLPIQVYDGATIDALKNKWGHDQKFRCLLKYAPPELVAMANKSAEDPDEWVTQDRVPYRKGVDEFRWERVNGTFVGPWSNLETNPRMHGYVDGLNDRFQVRCRRRDLPPMPEQKPKTETVTFYEVMVWRDGTRKLEWNECPSEACVGTGRTETRTIKGSL